MKSKICTQCKKEKVLSDFFVQDKKLGYLFSACKSCCIERTHKNRSKPENKKRWSQYHHNGLVRKYGLEPEDYEYLLTVQDGVCAICRNLCPSGRRLAVDHNHVTKKNRGLLCCNCNRALGLFKDSPTLLKTASEYMEAWVR